MTVRHKRSVMHGKHISLLLHLVSYGAGDLMCLASKVNLHLNINLGVGQRV